MHETLRLQSPLPILYEDNHLLIAVKPPALPTQPTTSDSEDLKSAQTLLQAFIKKRDLKPSGVFLHAIFRLDKPVSGVILFAKSSKGLERLQKIQREHSYRKEYVAFVHNPSRKNASPLKPGTLVDYLLRQEFHTKVTTSEYPEAKKAELEILSCTKVIDAPNPIYRVHLRLVTGRYHQIRAQLSTRGWPIVGDIRYGGEPFVCNGHQFSEQEIALHHMKLSFIHPIHKKGEEGAPNAINITHKPSWDLIKNDTLSMVYD